MLDLIFTNEDYMIENLRYIAPLGKSDHVGLLFTFITYSAIDTRVYGGKKHDYWKADSRLALSIATCANGATNFSLAKLF